MNTNTPKTNEKNVMRLRQKRVSCEAGGCGGDGQFLRPGINRTYFVESPKAESLTCSRKKRHTKPAGTKNCWSLPLFRGALWLGGGGGGEKKATK